MGGLTSGFYRINRLLTLNLANNYCMPDTIPHKNFIFEDSAADGARSNSKKRTIPKFYD